MTRRRPRVVFWDNLPSPYGVEQYNLLFDRGYLDLSVWFSARTEPGRSWIVDESAWRFPATYIDDPGGSLRALRRFAQACEHARPDLLVSPYGDRSYAVGYLIAKTLEIRTVLVVQRTFDAWVRRAWWKEAGKMILFRSADAAQVPGPDGAAYARRYGFPSDRIFPVTLTTNVQQYARPLSPGARRELRERLGVAGCVFLYVGRLWKPKGLISLIDAFTQVRARNSAISLLFVGDGVDEAEIRAAAAGVPGITFSSFVQAPDLYAYYAAADVFVFPTMGDPHGQVVEEAHAAGLPVIASDAVGDIHRRVTDDVNGFVVPPGDSAALASRMLALASDPHRRRAMGAAGAARVRGWGHETYAAEMERLVDACLGAAPRGGAAARLMAAAGRAALYLAMPSRGALHREFP
jgi:glycosyltransferase involved in cell wall biosynthesis